MALSLETVRQDVAIHGVSPPVEPGLAGTSQGSYRNELVRPTNDSSVLTKAAAEGPGSVNAGGNVRGLAQRVQKDAGTSTIGLRDSFVEMLELKQAPLPEMFEFVDELAELAGEEAAKEAGRDKIGEEREGRESSSHEERTEGDAPANANVLDTLRGREGRGGDGQSGEQELGHEHFEDGIHLALDKIGGDTNKAMSIALARGYFEAKGANLNFLNVLGKLAEEFQGVVEQSALAQLAAAEESMLATATLETSPAAVRRRYRKLLREKRCLGELFEELDKLGSEDSFWILLSEIGADLSGISGESDRDYLRSLTSELKKLWHMKSAYDETKELCRITAPHLSISGCKPDPRPLTILFLRYCGKTTVGPRDAQTLLELVKEASLQSQVVFANALKELHGRMPDGVWTTTTNRLLQHATLGTLCHRLTEAEERLYEAEAARGASSG